MVLDDPSNEMPQEDRLKHVLYFATFTLLANEGRVKFSGEQVEKFLDMLAGSTTTINVQSDEDGNVEFFLAWETEEEPC